MRFLTLGCGTSTGVPVPGCNCGVCLSSHPRNKRLRASALIQTNSGKNILIDATTDFRQQALRFKIQTLHAVLFTHAHADHILGIDDLRAFNFVLQGPIPCYASAKTWGEIARIFYYVFNPDPNHLGGAVTSLAINEISPPLPFRIEDVTIQPFALLHGNMEVCGFKIGELAYATDCNFVPAESRKLLRNIKYLIIDGLRYEPHKAHFSIPQALEIAGELGAQKTFITHTTHSVDYEEVNAKLPPGIELAYDGLEIEFN